MTFKHLYYLLTISFLLSIFCLRASTVSFSYTGKCEGEKTKFTNTTNWGNKYSWKFGDGTTSHDKNPEYTYTSPGTYEVTLVVSKDTVKDSLTQAITIYTTTFTKYDIIYDDQQACNPTSVDLCDTSTSTISRVWDFGDGTTGTDSSLTHMYDTPGYYTISLTTQTKYGCTRTGTFDSLVFNMPRPTAEFTIDPTNPTSYNSTITFIDKSDLAENCWWFWQLGDGAISYEKDPIHTFKEPGEYRITMTLHNNHGCADTIAHTIFISDMSSWYIPTSFTPNEDGINDRFLPVSHNLETKEFEFYVYDKWGNLVFQTKDIEAPWDGRSFKNQQLLPTGVYTWQMKIIYESGIELKKNGFINLLSAKK